jgi:nitroimidazol reductase NimA-like FMN-containing flavoprotein (pyridoxamine 5'-phosphate oxidase superfamily)
MSRDECLTALHEATIGRIAVSQDALPLILPVNFAFDGTHIVFRTRQGGILDRACRNTIIAFEIDDFNPASGSGWSVSVLGVANVMHGGEWLRAVELGLSSAGAADGSVFIKVTVGKVTGRALVTVSS